MSLKNKIVVLGARESGTGAAILAKAKGFEVFVSDKGIIGDKFKNSLFKHHIKFEEGQHTESEILSATEVIKSPGIPDKTEIIQKLKEKQIPIISEIEFASRYTDAKKICITGSNGKTTTTLLTYHILKKSGLNVGLAGNVGKSFAAMVAEKKHDYYVLELSSFQLDDMYKFKADIAILLNITPDHLDRYEYKMENYVNSKFRITNNQTENDAFIFCADDPEIMKALNNKNIKAKKYPFSITHQIQEGAWLNGNQINININNNMLTMTVEELALQGKHNIYNSMAAGIAARILDIRKEIIRESLSDFQNIEHRLEYVAKINDIEFINDSKSTNVNSAWYALESFDKPIIWIAGGVDKGNDYSILKDLVKAKVKAIVCLGKDNKKLIKAFKDIVPIIVETRSAEEAVSVAYRLGKKGDVVLLSPACASFDLFENYEDRGNKFKAAVRAL
jgi:UDP-N-acetylmuramoylalanine--D-glutamate ligase